MFKHENVPKFTKITVFLLITILSLVLVTGCNDSKEEATKQSQETSIESNEEPSEEVKSDIGTRKNPATFGGTIEYTATYSDTDIRFKLTLDNLIRGEDAQKLVLEMNQHNEWDEDEEPIIFDIDFELIDYAPEEDEPFFIDSTFDFSVFDSSYSQVITDNYLAVDNNLSGELYEGGSLSGKSGEIIPKGDRSYIVYQDVIWFELPE